MSPGLVCLHPGFVDPCFTLAFGRASLCLPGIKAPSVLLFVKLIHENFFRIKRGLPVALFPQGTALPAPSFIPCASSQLIFYQQLLVSHRDCY